MANGYIKWYGKKEGYGYIAQESGQPNLFAGRHEFIEAHLTDAQKGQRVSYEIATDPTGRESAVSLKLLDGRA